MGVTHQSILRCSVQISSLNIRLMTRDVRVDVGQRLPGAGGVGGLGGGGAGGLVPKGECGQVGEKWEWVLICSVLIGLISLYTHRRMVHWEHLRLWT